MRLLAVAMAEADDDFAWMKGMKPPELKLIAYDPKDQRKIPVNLPKEAILELAGGEYSLDLDPSRRRELARLVCESLLLIFPLDLPYDVFLPWSGADPEEMAAAIRYTHSIITLIHS